MSVYAHEVVNSLKAVNMPHSSLTPQDFYQCLIESNHTVNKMIKEWINEWAILYLPLCLKDWKEIISWK